MQHLQVLLLVEGWLAPVSPITLSWIETEILDYQELQAVFPFSIFVQIIGTSVSIRWQIYVLSPDSTTQVSLVLHEVEPRYRQCHKVSNGLR